MLHHLGSEAIMAQAHEKTRAGVTSAGRTVEIERSVLAAAFGTLEHVLASRFHHEEEPAGLFGLLSDEQREHLRLRTRLERDHRRILRKLRSLRAHVDDTEPAPLEAHFADLVRLIDRNETAERELRHVTLGRDY
jgi:hypothetical protein